MRMRTAVAVAAAALLVATGCASRRGSGSPCAAEPAQASGGPCGAPVEEAPAVSRVLSGDSLSGKIVGGCQCFYFEGVAYTLFDYGFQAASCDAAVPVLAIEDPEGRRLDLGSGHGAQGIVLRSTGVYRGVVCREASAGEGTWAFRYALRVAEPEDRVLELDPATRHEIVFHAPRGSNCIVTLRPQHDCGVVPMVVAVKDPDGGRALDPAVVLAGARAPVVDLGRGNVRVLRFNAPKPGRYTVIVSAEQGTSGPATACTQVFPPAPANRALCHDGQPCSGPSGGSPCAPPAAAASLRR